MSKELFDIASTSAKYATYWNNWNGTLVQFSPRPGIFLRPAIDRISSPVYPWYLIETGAYSKLAGIQENTVLVCHQLRYTMFTVWTRLRNLKTEFNVLCTMTKVLDDKNWELYCNLPFTGIVEKKVIGYGTLLN